MIFEIKRNPLLKLWYVTNLATYPLASLSVEFSVLIDSYLNGEDRGTMQIISSNDYIIETIHIGRLTIQYRDSYGKHIIDEFLAVSADILLDILNERLPVCVPDDESEES
jgi:hypothetical protein